MFSLEEADDPELGREFAPLTEEVDRTACRVVRPVVLDDDDDDALGRALALAFFAPPLLHATAFPPFPFARTATGSYPSRPSLIIGAV